MNVSLRQCWVWISFAKPSQAWVKRLSLFLPRYTRLVCYRNSCEILNIDTMTQIEPVAGQVSVLVLCHTRELAFQIAHEYERFSKYLVDIKTAVFYGGK
jgi:hypothetical protein